MSNYTAWEVLIGGREALVSARTRRPRERLKNARIYVEMDDAYEAEHRRVPSPSPEMFPDLLLPRYIRDGKKVEHVHTTRGEFPAVDKAWDAANRDYIRFARDAVTAGLDLAGLRIPKLRYSKTAGCSCPCSPGFIATDGLSVPGMGDQVDVWVTINASFMAQRAEKAREDALAAQIVEMGETLAREGVRV